MRKARCISVSARRSSSTTAQRSRSSFLLTPSSSMAKLTTTRNGSLTRVLTSKHVTRARGLTSSKPYQTRAESSRRTSSNSLASLARPSISTTRLAPKIQTRFLFISSSVVASTHFQKNFQLPPLQLPSTLGSGSIPIATQPYQTV